MSSIKGIFFDKSVLQMQTTRRFSCDRDSPLCFGVSYGLGLSSD
ncbi:hypothetical protein Patl1_27004 [Pistacia atlantica]|uniref:Uncharacterized protein n=1 Tax=Pistacia atlantica TaxID=434234 RepID=A0ACC1B0B2_9ROSI|nr:hypothetical protein Patl1_27004 [Pistacia atlantica]